MANPFFHNAIKDDNYSEHKLYNDAVGEICEIWGRDFKYLPKTLVKADHILGEDTLLAFNSATTVTFYIENFEEYSGDGDVFKSYGITIDDRLTLLVQQDNFDSLVGSKPQIGDLIFSPVSEKLFKVNYVNLDDSFHQFLGTNMSYRVECTLMKYSHETFNTGDSTIDDIGDETDSNTQDEITALTSAADEIIDFDLDFFGNQ